MQKLFSDSPKCHCFSHSKASRIQNNFFVAQPWWLAILFSVPWPLHFEIHFFNPMFACNYCESPIFMSIKLSRKTKTGNGAEANLL